MQREFLVTKMVCAKCGGNLSLSYETPKTSRHVDGEPTGAAMVEMRVAVHPCNECMAPLEALRSAARQLIAAAGV